MQSYFPDIGKGNLRSILWISIISISLQLISTLMMGVLIGKFGAIPDTAMGYFEIMRDNPLSGFLMDDFFSVLLVMFYLFSFLGVFFVLIKRHFAMTLVGTLMMYTAVILCISAHSGFSLLYLSEKYWAATDPGMQQLYLSAGEAVIAKNIWNSTPGFFSGLFLQGGGLLISLAMFSKSDFSKITALAGLIGNSLDLYQHLMGYLRFPVPSIILYLAGPFYLVWFIGIAVDLIRKLQKNNKLSTMLPGEANGKS